MAETPTADDSNERTNDEQAVSRRAAIKAAFGGAAAAAVWTAPRIEGLSVAPDYAAAASCSGGSISQITKNSNNCSVGSTECWGNNCCGTWNFGPSNVGGKFTLNGAISGSVNDDNGIVNLTVNGFTNSANQACTVNVAGNCNNGGSFRFRNGGGTFNFTSNGTQQATPDCQGGGGYYQDDPDGQLRINMTCVCN
ncbi:MAG: hypothetical protein KDB02_04665 [Acidimicrobiales bacterium]|nr:hypothetical protein [Acidimicrobiales bacterium]